MSLNAIPGGSLVSNTTTVFGGITELPNNVSRNGKLYISIFPRILGHKIELARCQSEDDAHLGDGKGQFLLISHTQNTEIGSDVPATLPNRFQYTLWVPCQKPGMHPCQPP